MPVTICLNMIVKNESKIITRLFDSILPIIDCYCICDTGSTDNTVEIIEKYFKEKNINGKIISEPFKDFGHNRTVALKAAHKMATYLLFLDADMKLQISKDFNKENLSADVYLIRQGATDFKYFNVRLIKANLDVKCVCPTHEYYELPPNCKQERLFSLFIDDVGDGGCKENKFKRDVRLLEEGLKKEPNNGRYYFYLANSYFNIGDSKKALQYYSKRIEIGGWDEEIYYSYFRLGKTYLRMGLENEAVITWLNGYNFYPRRTECVYQLVNYYRERGKNNIAYSFYKIGTSIPYPTNNVLFIHENMYHTLFDYELSIIAYYLIRDGLFSVDDIYGRCRKLLNTDQKMLNVNFYNNILSNYKFYSPKIEAISEKNINISTQMNDEFISSTPSIVLHRHSWILNLRYVNYKIDEKGDYVNQKQITTFNEFCTLDDNFSFITRKKFQEKEVDTKYRGIEDIRLLSFEDELLYSGVIQNTDKKDDVEVTVSIGKYNKKEDHIVQHNLISPENRKIEKNWVLFQKGDECKVVYQWHPLTIGKIDNNKFIKEDIIETPYLFHKFRGSTNGIIIGNELWFMCHVVSYEDRRFYYHCIVILNKDTYKLIDYSKLFTFSGCPVEYCLGMAEKKGDIIFSYSLMDNSSYIMSIKKKKILDMLF